MTCFGYPFHIPRFELWILVTAAIINTLSFKGEKITKPELFIDFFTAIKKYLLVLFSDQNDIFPTMSIASTSEIPTRLSYTWSLTWKSTLLWGILPICAIIASMPHWAEDQRPITGEIKTLPILLLSPDSWFEKSVFSAKSEINRNKVRNAVSFPRPFNRFLQLLLDNSIK